MPKPSQFERECALLVYLAQALRADLSDLFDPKVRHSKETGADVGFTFDGKTIGIQVTEYDGGEGVAGAGKSVLRRQEANLLRGGELNAMFVGNDPLSSIRARITEKIDKAKSFDFAEFDEVWLLVSANLEAVGTFVPRGLVTADRLAESSQALLKSSKYARAFYQQLIYPCLFRWSPPIGWQSHP